MELTANATEETVAMRRTERRRTSRRAIIGDMNVNKWRSDLTNVTINIFDAKDLRFDGGKVIIICFFGVACEVDVAIFDRL